MEKELLRMSKPLKFLIGFKKSNPTQYNARGPYLSGEMMKLICFNT